MATNPYQIADLLRLMNRNKGLLAGEPLALSQLEAPPVQMPSTNVQGRTFLMPPKSPEATMPGAFEARSVQAPQPQPTGGDYIDDIEGWLGKGRPTAPQVRERAYSIPPPPSLQELPTMPRRNVGREQRAMSRDGLIALGLGTLLGGAQGGIAAAQGLQKGMGGAFDAQDENRQRNFQVQAQQVQNQNRNALQGFDSQLDAVNRQMVADRNADTNELRGFDNQLDGWGAEQNRLKGLYDSRRNRETRQGIADQTSADRNAANDTRRELGLSGLDIRRDYNRIQEKLANSLMSDRLEDNDRLQTDLDEKTGYHNGLLKIAKQNADTNTRRAAIAEVHDAWMQSNAALRTSIMQTSAAMRSLNSGVGGPKPMTQAQMDAINKELSMAPVTIDKIRRSAGNPPDATSSPEEVQQYMAQKAGAEQAAQDFRNLLNEKAARVGKVFSNGGYVPTSNLSGEEIDALRTGKSAQQLQGSAKNVSPIILPPIPAYGGPTAREQGFPSRTLTVRPTASPQPQRATPAPRRATPPPKPTPQPQRAAAPTPKPSFLVKDPAKLTSQEKNELANYLRKKLKG
jgi:hypothetical protein